MAFRKVIPRSRSSCGDVKVSFSGGKTIYANIYISINFLKKMGWDSNCRVFVYFDDENPRIWMIEKALDSEKNTFKLSMIKNGKDDLSKLQFKFSECKITIEDRKLKVVNYEVKDEKIIIREKI